jgi:hypothetical protein
MERRNRSIEALSSLKYIDLLNDELRAKLLQDWVEKYLVDSNIEDFDLEKHDLNVLSELFYKNINFLKQHRVNIRQEIEEYKKIREFLK